MAKRMLVTYSSTRGADGDRMHDCAPAARWMRGRRIPAREGEKALAAWVGGLGL